MRGRIVQDLGTWLLQKASDLDSIISSVESMGFNFIQGFEKSQIMVDVQKQTVLNVT